MTLGDGHPCAAEAVLPASELVSNSVLHSRSRETGGKVTITVWGGPLNALVEVTDDGGDSVPAVRGGDAEGGRGLVLVEQIAHQRGHRPSEGNGCTTWFEVRADTQPHPGPGQPSPGRPHAGARH
jgi:anti-sigma regulatory factor (Ser/Thr protein kinase)